MKKTEEKQTEFLERIVRSYAEMLGLDAETMRAAVGAVAGRKRILSAFLARGTDGRGWFGTGFGAVPYRKLEKKYGGALALAATLVTLDRTKTLYEAKNIPLDPVFYDTVSDLKIWAGNYRATKGTQGLGELGWIRNHLNLWIFRLGRLQFQPTRITDPFYAASGVGKLGEQAVFVHIPQGEPLDFEKAKESFRRAVAFFDRYYPEIEYRRFFTETWLLYGRNREFMDENSNVLKFSGLFRHAADRNFENEAKKRIFGAEYAPRAGETSLQASCRAYLERGGTLGVGVGFVEKSDVSAL